MRSRAAVTVEVYSRPSGYWYADAYLADGRKVATSAAYSRHGAVRELRLSSPVIGRELTSVVAVDGPRNYAPPVAA